MENSNAAHQRFRSDSRGKASRLPCQPATGLSVAFCSKHHPGESRTARVPPIDPGCLLSQRHLAHQHSQQPVVGVELIDKGHVPIDVQTNKQR